MNLIFSDSCVTFAMRKNEEIFSREKVRECMCVFSYFYGLIW